MSWLRTPARAASVIKRRSSSSWRSCATRSCRSARGSTNAVITTSRPQLTAIRPEMRVQPGQVDRSPHRLADLRVDVQPPAIRARLGQSGDQLPQAAAVDEVKLGEIQANVKPRRPQVSEALAEYRGYGQIQLPA